MAPKQTDPQFKLRLPPDLKEALEAAAQRNNRSVSAEILARLTDTFRYENKEEIWDRRIAELDRKHAELQADLELLRSRSRD
ncbi:Arc family DNA-binding protein [Sinorhizobium meliloti]|uniref:Arc family DNA-binding protein n=1 Tax=Rhizobium meliloti TaxID=382 RepID=UPI000FDB4F23|nr:Arc family DNA-binding protein [Sinorhizobium meliloti]MDW9582497.1 Arc family DNA-binding protein [Sinorhizobium meliloti]RVL63416.1 Arc family DNA-binding protein [Sinorhizobium meliloti]